MKKVKVLVLCTGNSCRSIIAEAMINSQLEGIFAESSGVKASGKVNPNAKKLLEKKQIWKNSYYSKTLDKVLNNNFDLIITVCDHAKETCPIFPKPIPKIHISFQDPEGKDFSEFEKLWIEMENKLLPIIKKTFEKPLLN